MKTLFREHRGSLEDSLQTMVEVETLKDIQVIISDKFFHPVLDLKSEYYTYDGRISWDTYIITGEVEGTRIVVGFTKGEVEK